MRHEELVGLSLNPNFEKAKDKIFEGLSYRLDHFEKRQIKDYKINLKPRKNYGAEMEK